MQIVKEINQTIFKNWHKWKCILIIARLIKSGSDFACFCLHQIELVKKLAHASKFQNWIIPNQKGTFLPEVVLEWYQKYKKTTFLLMRTLPSLWTSTLETKNIIFHHARWLKDSSYSTTISSFTCLSLMKWRTLLDE